MLDTPDPERTTPTCGRACRRCPGCPTGRLDLTDLLVQVATYAVQAIPGADGAGLTMMERDRANTIVASAPFVREIDAIQYGIGAGSVHLRC